MQGNLHEVALEHVDVETKRCPVCDTFTQEHFPQEMSAPLQYGTGIKAYVINLVVCQRVSLNSVQKMFKTLIDEKLSEASLLTYVLRLYEVLAVWESSAVDKRLTLKALNVDETSLRVDNKNQWIHVYAGEDIT